MNAIDPDFIRLRTFLPKINTLLYHQYKKGRFQMLSAHGVLREAKRLIENLEVNSVIYSDHYNQLVLVVDDYEKGRMVSEGWMKNPG